MTNKELFTSSTFRNKFSHDDIQRVKNWMQNNGYLDDPKIMPGTASAALILLSFTATESDLNEFGEIILHAETQYPEPESLHYVISYLLQDELTAATAHGIIFDRMAGQVLIKLIDGSGIKAVDLPVPITPAWKADTGIQWKQTELVHLASDIQQDFHKGELLSDKEFQSIIDEHDSENFNDN